MKKEFGILIDSAACCDETYLKTNDIHIVPLSLSDSNNKVYEDNGIDLPRDILLSRMDNNESFKTSATPLGKLTVIVEDMLDVYEKVIFVPISEGLSSQYQQSMIIKADHPNNFFVVKSSSAGAATEFLLPHLIGWLKDKIPMEQILNKAEEFYYHTNTYFSCEDMRSMIKGGRVSNAILKIINWIHSKPIIYVDGKNQLGGIGKTYQTILPKMIKLVKKNYKNDLTPSNVKRIAIYETGYSNEKKDFIINALASGFGFPKDQIAVRQLPSTILSHTRRGAYGFSIETDIIRKK